MQGLGFKTQNSIDFSQFIVLIVFLGLLAGVSLYLKRRAANGNGLLKMKRSRKASELTTCHVQHFDKQTCLQEITRGDTLYLVLKTDSGPVLLDKVLLDSDSVKSGEARANAYQKHHGDLQTGKSES